MAGKARPLVQKCPSCHFNNRTDGQPVGHCRLCGEIIGDASKFISARAEVGKNKKLVQVRWHCGSCGHFGILMTNRMDGNDCPKCGNKITGGKRIRPEGECKSGMWKEIGRKPIKKILEEKATSSMTRNTIMCAVCGNNMFFYSGPPHICSRCRRPL